MGDATRSRSPARRYHGADRPTDQGPDREARPRRPRPRREGAGPRPARRGVRGRLHGAAPDAGDDRHRRAPGGRRRRRPVHPVRRPHDAAAPHLRAARERGPDRHPGHGRRDHPGRRRRGAEERGRRCVVRAGHDDRRGRRVPPGQRPTARLGVGADGNGGPSRRRGAGWGRRRPSRPRPAPDRGREPHRPWPRPRCVDLRPCRAGPISWGSPGRPGRASPRLSRR